MPQNKRRKMTLYILGGLVVLAIWYFVGYWRRPLPSVAMWLLDIFVLGVALIGGIMLASQFALPVSAWKDRNLAFSSMLQFLQGGHGPIIFVRNGSKVARPGEEDKRGPGVILLDSASAVALQTNVAYKRSAGPGVTFTQPGEFIADTIDLRVQSRTNKNVKAVTRDGINIKANIIVRFMLRRGHVSPGQWETDQGPPYYFEEHPAFLAVFGTAVRERYNVSWTELPALVAADVWREFLLERTLSDLLPEEHVDPLPFTALQQALTQRLQPPADQLPDAGSLEYRVLHDRGIQVLVVSVANVEFPEEFYSRRKLKWQTEMLRRTKDELYESEVDSLHREGFSDGWMQLREILTRDLRQKMISRISLTVRKVARILIDATLEIINRPSVTNLARREQETVLEMRSWLDSLDETGAQLLIAQHDDAIDAE